MTTPTPAAVPAAPPKDFPARVADEIIAAKRKFEMNAKTFMKSDVESIVRALWFEEKKKGKRRRKPKGVKIPQVNPLFDALALATGTKDLREVTRNAGKMIGVALRDIAEVTLDLEPAEIYRRAAAYKSRHPTWDLTATALAKHWGEFGRGEQTRSARTDPYQIPKFDWLAIMRARYPGAVLVDSLASGESTWSDIPIDIRKSVIAEGLSS